MRSILVLAAVAAGSATLFGQGVNTALIKQRAREVTGAKQAPLPPPAAAAPGAAAARSPAATINQAVISKLSASIATIKIRPEASSEQKDKLAQVLTAAAQSGAQAPAEAMTKLAGDLAAAIAGKKFTAQDQALVARNLAGLLGSQNLSAQVVGAVLTSTKDTLLKAGASEELAQAVVLDLQAIVAGSSKAASAPAK